MFGMQIEFSGIFYVFPKIPLMEAVANNGGWRPMAVRSGLPMAVDGARLVVDDDPQLVALGGDQDILVFLLWQIFLPYGNVGFL